MPKRIILMVLPYYFMVLADFSCASRQKEASWDFSPIPNRKELEIFSPCQNLTSESPASPRICGCPHSPHKAAAPQPQPAEGPEETRQDTKAHSSPWIIKVLAMGAPL